MSRTPIFQTTYVVAAVGGPLASKLKEGMHRQPEVWPLAVSGRCPAFKFASDAAGPFCRPSLARDVRCSAHLRRRPTWSISTIEVVRSAFERLQRS